MTRTTSILAQLRRYESRNVTFIESDASWPIVWEQARGVHVWDAEGRRYLDLTAAFGVAAAGHANLRVVRAGQRQMSRLLHAMGDVHPHALKAQLARELSRLTFERWQGSKPKAGSRKPKQGRGASLSAKTIFCNSGFEAVEAALKTARLATGRPGIIAFEGAYHGLGYGALNVTHREHFRAAFRNQLREFACFIPFPHGRDTKPEAIESHIRRLLQRQAVGAILVEPIQGRGGIRIPPSDFLRCLRELCDAYGALLIVDEVFTGFGRTGKWFACEHSGVTPDLICLGKALTGGFPLSACVGRADAMDAAWPPSTGEAIHTSTFLGHPVGCAMALAQIGEIERRQLVKRSAALGRKLLVGLSALSDERSALNARSSRLSASARGLGLMAGLELRHCDGSPATALALDAIKAMLDRGFILLSEGADSNVISFTPPLNISERQLASASSALREVLAWLDSRP